MNIKQLIASKKGLCEKTSININYKFNLFNWEKNICARRSFSYKLKTELDINKLKTLISKNHTCLSSMLNNSLGKLGSLQRRRDSTGIERDAAISTSRKLGPIPTIFRSKGTDMLDACMTCRSDPCKSE
jgi:hypothetical protein